MFVFPFYFLSTILLHYLILFFFVPSFCIRFDRDWKKIEAFVGSKTVIQVISNASCDWIFTLVVVSGLLAINVLDWIRHVIVFEVCLIMLHWEFWHFPNKELFIGHGMPKKKKISGHEVLPFVNSPILVSLGGYFCPSPSQLQFPPYNSSFWSFIIMLST